VKYLVVVLVLGLLLVALGAAAFVYDGADDSPGLQLVGLMLAAGAVVLGVRAFRRPRAS
jgi:membrane protein implicated in regulation of membrane protease activity